METREFKVAEMRAPEDGKTFSGYAAVFNQEARIAGMFYEVILPGAFNRTINNGSDVYAFWNHNHDIILGRRKNNTLTLREDDLGLFIEATPPNNPESQAKRQLIRDGYVDKMSFSFDVVEEEWVHRDDNLDLRRIKEVKLYEVSPVPFPAYGGTSVSARGFYALECEKRLTREQMESLQKRAESFVKENPDLRFIVVEPGVNLRHLGGPEVIKFLNESNVLKNANESTGDPESQGSGPGPESHSESAHRRNRQALAELNLRVSRGENEKKS